MRRKNLAPTVRTDSFTELPQRQQDGVIRAPINPRDLGLCAHGVADHADCCACRSKRCCGGSDCHCDQTIEDSYPAGFYPGY